jgi:hypothetical protein
MAGDMKAAALLNCIEIELVEVATYHLHIDP